MDIESNTASNDILKDIKEQVTNMDNNPFLEDIKKQKLMDFVLKRKGAMKTTWSHKRKEAKQAYDDQQRKGPTLRKSGAK